ALARSELAYVFRSPAYGVLLVLGLVNAGATLRIVGDLYGSPSYPVTRLLVNALSDGYTFFIGLVAVFYAGELVWRDRDRRLHEIIDATAAPDWMHVAPKALALALALLAAMLAGAALGVAMQLGTGCTHWQPLAWLGWFVWPATVGCVLVAILSVFVQVLVPNKQVGWLVMAGYGVLAQAMDSLGWQDHLYTYGGTSPVPLSDMNGAGRFWIGALWFQAYWLAFGVVLLVFAHGFWRRGSTTALRARLGQMRRRLAGRGPRAILAAAVLAWAGSGGWIYYNTHVLNAYRSSADADRLAAGLEKTLLPFERVVQPKVADVTLDVQLWPRRARVVTHGRYTLVNRSAQPIAALHLQWDRRLRLDSVELPGAGVQADYPAFHYRIYRLATPMQPGERRTLGFTTTLEERGFPNDAPLTEVVENGSFLNNALITPSVGFSREGLLHDRGKRRRNGLPPQLRPPALEDAAARAFNVTARDSDWVTSDITVTTDADQTPVAPGRVVSDTGPGTDPDGRRRVRFVSDAPIAQFFSIQSARYDVRHDVWHAPGRDVDLAVYYAPGHEANVDRMIAAMRLALALDEAHFSPYQFGQARIVEFPAYGNFAQSYANTIPFAESIGFEQHWTDPSRIDIATYVTAHEIGHQWWGHQLLPADQQGAAMLTESFAQYSALLAMDKRYGHAQVRRFLRYELDRYLRGRGRAAADELPLYRVEDQDYVYYRKGALVMYRAAEVLGEDVVERAMRRLLARHAFQGPPYPDTLDFLRALRAEAGPSTDALVTDLFERITLYDLRVHAATATRRADGRWNLELDVEAHKFHADGAGRQAEVPMDEPVELGAFAAAPGGRGFHAGD
ncbi:MAG TPA: M1 family aminopeptidase, partial [Burkholderiaceae bacterium]